MNDAVKGLVSVITPTYNRLSMLLDRSREIAAQSYTDWEWIIINDCSTDNTATLEERISDERVRLINLHKNSGNVSIPRAVGIHHAKGEYICHADDDCVNLPRKLEILVSLLESNPDAVLAYGNRINLHLPDNREERIPYKPDWNPTLPNGWGIDGSQFAYRANVYEKIPYVICNRACDYELAKKIYPLGRLLSTPQVVSKYIWHGKNRSLDDSTKTSPILIEEFRRYLE